MCSATKRGMHPWIEVEKPSTAVLLGAGASQPFVPTSKQLTKLVVDSFDQEFTADNDVQKLWRAIRPEVSDIGDDIEYLYQAVETLGYQSIDPTRHWITGFKKYGEYEDSDAGREAFGRDARVLTGFIASHAYRLVAEHSEGASLDHFIPMLQAPLLGIVSLNYDLLIEEAAQSCGVSISTGANEWDAGHRWIFPEEALPLLKMHGSVNWRRSRPILPTWQIPRTGIFEMDAAGDVAPNGKVDSSLIFGGGNKLRPDEPWPALYAAFEELLARAETLVVGYSFRDHHVDAAIRRWAAQSATRRIINLEPYPTEHPSIQSTIGDLRYALDPDCVTAEGMIGLLVGTGRSRFDFIQARAVDGIPRIFA